MKPGTAEWGCAFFCLFTAQGHPPIFGVWCLRSSDPPAARSSNCSVGCSPSSSTLFGGKLCITVLQNLCFPGCRLSSARDPHDGPRSTTALHGDGDGFLPGSGWHFLQHLPSVRPVAALSDAPLETEPPAQEAAGFTAQWPVHARESPGWDLCGTSGRQAEQTRMGESTPAQTALGMGLTSG